MFITSGKLKRKTLLTSLKSKSKLNYRPSSARTRLAIFNILANASYLSDNFVEGAVVADVCAGSGSFGFEALSRGAKQIYFIDIEQEHIEVARKNAQKLNVIDNVAFIRADSANLPKAFEPCKIVYLDPPYRASLASKSVKSLINAGWLAEKNLIIVELDKREDIGDMPGLIELDRRLYGKTKIMFYTYKL
jgi:16S rRNA (guanine966-N2)-methyltransferase